MEEGLLCLVGPAVTGVNVPEVVEVYEGFTDRHPLQNPSENH